MLLFAENSDVFCDGGFNLFGTQDEPGEFPGGQHDDCKKNYIATSCEEEET
jgi:hypothetical protein